DGKQKQRDRREANQAHRWRHRSFARPSRTIDCSHQSHLDDLHEFENYLFESPFVTLIVRHFLSGLKISLNSFPSASQRTIPEPSALTIFCFGWPSDLSTSSIGPRIFTPLIGAFQAL